MGHYRTNIHVLGDPIQDIWKIGKLNMFHEWEELEHIDRPGGAANVLSNIHKLLHTSSPSRYTYQLWKSVSQPLIRVIDYDEEDRLAYKRQFWLYEGDHTKMYSTGGGMKAVNRWTRRQAQADGWHPDVLVLSDYNKGVLNGSTKRQLLPYRLAVVDSRYRTLHSSWLKSSEIKIWHATGEEYDTDWADQFDYVVHSNGPDPVRIYCHPKYGFNTQYVDVPTDTPVVDTIGAGDTLTASLAVYLSNHLIDLSLQQVIYATEFGVAMCQEVIQQKYTAVPYSDYQSYTTAHSTTT